MPNWTANSLKLTATNDQTRELLARIREELKKDKPELFQLIEPCPQALRDTTKGFPKDTREDENFKNYGFATWYEFHTEKWGTKWDAREIYHEDQNQNTIILFFDTAWSPPFAIYEKLNAAGFKTEATFCECGCSFIGYYKNGEIFEDDFDWDEAENQEAEYLEEYFQKHDIEHNPQHIGG